MCRLYGFRATEPTKVECSLVHAQNALLVQSRRDRAGESHIHGWGVAAYEDHTPIRDRQAWAAYHGEHFRRAAARIYAESVLAHVRKATVGPPNIDNTHPFVDQHWSFIHNGTVPGFAAMRERMVATITDMHRDAIQGDTDSEHVFRLLLSVWAKAPAKPLMEVVRDTIRQVLAWCEECRPRRTHRPQHHADRRVRAGRHETGTYALPRSARGHSRLRNLWLSPCASRA